METNSFSLNKLLGIFIALLIVASSCKEQLNDNIENLLGNEINFDVSKYKLVKGRRNFFPNKTNYTMFIYFDSDECQTCAASRLHDWDQLIFENLNRKVGFQYVFSPDINSINKTILAIKSSGFIRNVYVDTADIFKTHHPWIAKAKENHIFLIDKNNKIVMVGDPRRNKNLMKLFNEIVSDSIAI